MAFSIPQNSIVIRPDIKIDMLTYVIADQPNFKFFLNPKNDIVLIKKKLDFFTYHSKPKLELANHRVNPFKSAKSCK